MEEVECIEVVKEKHIEKPKILRGGGHDTPIVVMEEQTYITSQQEKIIITNDIGTQREPIEGVE
jgi:hypothetical protein